jgi:hypothetical protein
MKITSLLAVSTPQVNDENAPLLPENVPPRRVPESITLVRVVSDVVVGIVATAVTTAVTAARKDSRKNDCIMLDEGNDDSWRKKLKGNRTETE